jgi:hypothetical protein
MGKINFGIKGTFGDFYQGRLPTFSRPSPLFLEKEINGSLDLIAISSNEPAIYNSGNFVIAPEIVNLLTYSDDLKSSEWIAGSNVFVRREVTRGAVSVRQEADSIAVIAGKGQDEESRKRQILRRSIHLEPNKAHTAWTVLRLANGSAGVGDVFRVTQSGSILAQASLGEMLNDAIDANKRIDIQFVPIDETLVHIEFFMENSMTLEVTIVQVERRNFPTLPVYQQSAIVPVEPTILYYHQSPLKGLRTFGVMGAIEYWRGDGNVVECGDFKVAIKDKKLCVEIGTSSVASEELPNNFKFYVQVVGETGMTNVYIDGKLAAKTPSPNLYRASEAAMVLSSEGLRCFQHLVCTEGLMEDGRVEIGHLALKDIKRLFEGIPIPAEIIGSSAQKFIGKPVEVPPASVDESGFVVPGYAAARMPFLAIDPQEIEKLFPSTQEVQINSTLSFKPGKAFIQTLAGADIRTVEVISADNASRRLKLDTIELLLPGQIISQPAPNGETIVPWQNYGVDFLYPSPTVSVVGSYGDGIVLSNKGFEPCTVIPVYKINL